MMMGARDKAAGPFAGGMRYNPYGAFLREKFGCRVHKVAVDAGFTCPNRDGAVASGGCTYCDNDSFRAASANYLLPVPEQIDRGIEYLAARFRAEKFIVYFQPHSNTYAPLERLIPLFESALRRPEVVGLSIGTRPDCIDEPKLAWFENLARTRFVTLEYGLESMHDDTLARINRGHDFACWEDAVRRTRGRGIYLCVHLILGFPWEGRRRMLATADAVSEAGVDFLKLHHLHVVRGTELARSYLRDPFPLLEPAEYIDLLVDFLERLGPGVRVERLFGDAPRERLLGPMWNGNRAGIRRGVEEALAARATWQGRLCRAVAGPSASRRKPR